MIGRVDARQRLEILAFPFGQVAVNKFFFGPWSDVTLFHLASFNEINARGCCWAAEVVGSYQSVLYVFLYYTETRPAVFKGGV